MKKYFCGLLAVLLAFSSSAALASPRPEGSFRLGGGGKDMATSAPLVLNDDRLVVAILTRGGLGNVTYETDEAQTWLACLDTSQNVQWEVLVKGMASLYGLDENGNIQALCWYSEHETRYSQFRVFSAETGDVIDQKAAMPLKTSQVDDPVSIHSLAMPDYLLVQEIYDSSATTQPRILTLQDSSGNKLWTIDQQIWQLENIEEVVQMVDGILLIGNSSVLDDGSFYHAMAVKLSFEGQTLWQYCNDALPCGNMNRVLKKTDEHLIFQGFGRTPNETAVGNPYSFLLELDSKTGSVIREKTFSDHNAQLPVRGAFFLSSSGNIAVCSYNSEQQQFDCSLFDDQWNATERFSMKAPGIGNYRQIDVFDWQGELWIQALSDLDYRMDAHYQKIEKP